MLKSKEMPSRFWQIGWEDANNEDDKTNDNGYPDEIPFE